MLRLSGFRRDRRGVAAVEMALIAPIIAGMALVSFGIWRMATSLEDMHVALKAGASYYMNGGLDDTAARTLMTSAWQDAPADASIGVQRACKCGTVAAACNVLCANATPPSSYVLLNASGTGSTGTVNFPLSEQKVVRVR